MTDLLFQLEDPSPEGVRELMDRLNVGVVVTVREDARLPADGDAADPWRRYASAGITWVDKRSEQLPPSHGRSGVSTPGSSSISDESLIEVLVKANPKREGSRSHAIFQRMMDAAAQAIQEGRMLTVGEARRVGYRSIDLKWDSDPERGAPTETGAHIRILKP